MKTIYAPMYLSGILYADQCLSLKRHDSLYVLSSLLLWLVAMCDGKLNFGLKSLILDNSVLGGIWQSNKTRGTSRVPARTRRHPLFFVACDQLVIFLLQDAFLI